MVIITTELILEIVLKVLATVFPILLSITYLIYFERKIIASMQLRKGPSVVGPFGLLQPIADALKFVFKEIIIPKNVNSFLFLLAPVIAFVLALIQFVVIPFDKAGALAEINVGVLYILAVSGLAIYGILIAGISSNSRYSFMGAVRAAASMISYEISIGLIILTMVVLTGSLNLSQIIESSHSFPLVLDILLLPLLSVFFIAILAETNRHPFDLPESESELVGGYNVEYSSLAFAMFFLAEYANMILMSSVITIFFLGGWYPPFSIGISPNPNILWFILKVLFILFMFVWVRASLPRYRFDHLIKIGWNIFVPITTFYLILMILVKYFIL